MLTGVLYQSISSHPVGDLAFLGPRKKNKMWPSVAFILNPYQG